MNKEKPTIQDAERAASCILADNLMGHANLGLGDEKEEIADDIARALESARPSYDGYQIAKSLDDNSYWEVDSDMVSELDDANRIVEEEMKKLLTAWVKETGYVHPYKVGDIVTAKWGGKIIEGPLQDIRMNGTALVKLQDRSGMAIVKWDDIHIKQETT